MALFVMTGFLTGHTLNAATKEWKPGRGKKTIEKGKGSGQ